MLCLCIICVKLTLGYVYLTLFRSRYHNLFSTSTVRININRLMFAFFVGGFKLEILPCVKDFFTSKPLQNTSYLC